MAESVGAFEFYPQETLKDLLENGKQIDLKPEQRAAIKSLVQPVLAKALFIQYSCELRRRWQKYCACVLVICPLRSLIEDQISFLPPFPLICNF